MIYHTLLLAQLPLAKHFPQIGMIIVSSASNKVTFLGNTPLSGILCKDFLKGVQYYTRGATRKELSYCYPAQLESFLQIAPTYYAFAKYSLQYQRLTAESFSTKKYFLVTSDLMIVEGNEDDPTLQKLYYSEFKDV